MPGEQTLSIEQRVGNIESKGIVAGQVLRQQLGFTNGIPVGEGPDRTVDGLADAIAAPYDALVYLLAFGGLRWGEAAALRRRHIDVLRSRIEVAESLAEVGGRIIFGSTKNHRRRSIVVPRFLRDLLNEHLTTKVGPEADALVFTSPGLVAGPLRHSNFRNRAWLPAVEAAGLAAGLRIHDLRHTAAALLISQAAHPEAIKRHLGHSSIVVTMDDCGHLFPSEEDALAGATRQGVPRFSDGQETDRRLPHHRPKRPLTAPARR